MLIQKVLANAIIARKGNEKLDISFWPTDFSAMHKLMMPS